MISTAETPLPFADARHRIVVALDVERESDAFAIANEFKGLVGGFKVGLQLFTAAGPGMIHRMVEQGLRIFLDLKFHDIPNTVAKASVEAARLGVWMFNVHAAGGSQMMRTAVEEVSEFCYRENRDRPVMIAVTVLTSSAADSLTEQGIVDDVNARVERLARLAASAGLDGVVASPREVPSIRAAVPDTKFLTVTPGIRPADATVDDQKRVTTLRAALSSGTDYVVIGRPITRASNRIKALDQMLEELSQ